MAEVGADQTALFVTVGTVARRLLDASGALRDYPRRHGREQARHLHLDAVQAGTREYDRIYERTRDDLRALVSGEPIEEAAAAHRLYVILWTAQAGCGWPLLAILQVAQRLKELWGHDHEFDRYLLLILPTGTDDRSVPALGRSYAILLSLEAAELGVEVVSGRVLSAPVAECTVVIGQRRGVPPPLDAQLRRAGAVLRLLADVGPLGSRVRGHLEQQRRADALAGMRTFTSIGVGSLETDRDLVADHVAGLLLDGGDQAERGHLEEAWWR